MDVTIVGGGLWGLSTAWALLRQGAMSITILDQGPVPNPIASSYDQHRLIRYPYDEQDGYSLLVDDAYMAWNNLWRDLRISHYVETGSLCLAGTSAHDWTSKSRRSLDRVGKEYDVWTPTEIERVCPHLNLDGIRYGIFLPQGGVLLADRILADLARFLRRSHVKFRQNVTVQEIDAQSRRVVLADTETIESDAIVVCVGAWAGKLLPQISNRLTPKRQCVVYLKPPPQHEAAWNRAPSIVDTGSVDGYAVPPVAGTNLKMGWLPHAEPEDPDVSRIPRPDEANGMLQKLAPVLKDAETYQIIASHICFYGMAPESRFIVEPLDTRERCWVMTGGSGHGFKFGPLLGQAMARRLAGIDHRSAPDFGRWAAGLEETG